MIKLPLDIQNSISGALTPGKDKVWETEHPTLRKWQGKSLKKMHIGLGNMKKADDKKSKEGRKRKNQTEEDKKRKEKIAENEDEEGEIKR